MFTSADGLSAARSSLGLSPRTTITIVFACTFLAHRLMVIIYRLFISPLAKFPYPKVAAATGLYEQYFNVVRKGRYVFEIERLHNAYGPIVRVNPQELSIRDADFYDKVYVYGSVRLTDNYNHFVDGIDFQLEGSHFFTTPHDLHRGRRKPLEPYFSRLGVDRLEPTIRDLAEKVVKRFEALKDTDTVVRLDYVMLCYTGDVISNVCCENPTSLLDDERFSTDCAEQIRLVRSIPETILLRIDRRSQLFNDWKDMAEKHILEVKREENRTDGTPLVRRGNHTTLFRHFVNSNLLESEFSVPRLVNEAQVLLGARTACVLDLICYYILADSDVRARMTEELAEVMADWPGKRPTLTQLEKLPYFLADIKEGLRLSYGMMRRLPRVSPNVSIQCREWSIPAGTPVEISAYMQHTNPDVFPEPFRFLPERWLPGNVTPAMNRNFVPFSKGSRNCLGINLTQAEISHILAALFREGAPQFQLYHTDESDVALVHDFIVPLPKIDSKGICVIFP
ncbi:cytochrome P450 [Trematosphaeria pertusa]|uniref:Cytochrome P450 n=1 Tax=Trematosphaeria pertusa TaxID=390896 RepID=A0A6A6IIQ9_9PLEO|nr:cytochrome P450 [Trematosphaeria pertusa]KAF2250067.1 cytochrome P450 [Trematosphaeria pertusa]